MDGLGKTEWPVCWGLGQGPLTRLDLMANGFRKPAVALDCGQIQGLLEMLNGSGKLPLSGQRDAQIIVSLEIFRVELKRSRVMFNGFSQFALARQRNAQINPTSATGDEKKEAGWICLGIGMARSKGRHYIGLDSVRFGPADARGRLGRQLQV